MCDYILKCFILDVKSDYVVSEIYFVKPTDLMDFD